MKKQDKEESLSEKMKTKSQNKKQDKRTHDIETRIKRLEGKKLTKEDLKIYCYSCGKEIKNWEFWIPFRIEHSFIGWSHRNC